MTDFPVHQYLDKIQQLATRHQRGDVADLQAAVDSFVTEAVEQAKATGGAEALRQLAGRVRILVTTEKRPNAGRGGATAGEQLSKARRVEALEAVQSALLAAADRLAGK